MTRLFLFLYDFFDLHKKIFWSVFLALLVLLGLGASRIEIEEDITKFFPDDKRVEGLNYIFQNAKLTEQLVVMVSMRDSTATPEPDSLVAMADRMITQLDTKLKPYIKKITGQIDDERVLGIFDMVNNHLPVFLDERDYIRLDSLLKRKQIRRALQENHNQLISPAAIGLKQIILQDPLGLSFLVLGKLKNIQYDSTFELYDGFIITRDQKNLMLFITPLYPPMETGHNTYLVQGLNSIIEEISGVHPVVKISFFGAPAVAVGNALQLRRDTILTLSIMVVILLVFLVGFFRKKRVPFLIFIPVAFGGLFSLCCIALFKGSVSILALAAGSVILGIAVNYALHFLAHLKHEHDVRTVVADLVTPMTLGSTTTVLAFFCLQFTNAAVLRDVGLFAGFSLIGAALCSLIILPHFLKNSLFGQRSNLEKFLEKLPVSAWSGKYVMLGIGAITLVFLYFARFVTFDSDVSKLNFMSDQTREAQHQLESINRSSAGTSFLVSRGKNIEEALRRNERIIPILEQLSAGQKIRKYSSITSLVISDSLQQDRIRKWNTYWTPQRKAEAIAMVREEGSAMKFSEVVLNNFERQVERPYAIPDPDNMKAIRTDFFDDYIIEKDSLTTVITLVNIDPAEKAAVYDTLHQSNVEAFDRQMLANLFVRYVNADFNFIVLFTAGLVFVSLLISYGRMELTLITFIPMFITWIWILGIMGLLGIQFNIVNVMVSTFIFGLGDDYSIFIMDGLQQEYKSGRKNLPSIRISIFLSAVTTIAGLGVLIFAQHPAMRSIAAISIIGIICVFVMSQTVEPYLFRLLITQRTKSGKPPATLLGSLLTTLTYGVFIAGSMVLTVIGILFRVIPFYEKKTKLVFHQLVSGLARTIIYLQPHIRKKIVNRSPNTFNAPSIIIANHSSVVDILLTIMLHPRLILLTNHWVWNSPIMGGVVRLADYYPVDEGLETSVEKFRNRVSEGYSIVIFPEGSRSEDRKIKRFHKGAFYLAEALSIPIRPLIIHGAGYTVPKGTFYLNPGQFTLKFLPLITNQDHSFGLNYQERTKSISRYFKQAYQEASTEIETVDYFARRLISNYIYKGPVLEWYLRFKLKLENNYSSFYDLLPRVGTILDLGCGYGFLCYMLNFRASDQTIIGVDFDVEKIATANHGYLKSSRLHFYHKDVMDFELTGYAGIVISDVLHYLESDQQEELLNRCCLALAPGGILIVRNGNIDLKDRHWGTELSEFFSTKLLQFNKSVHRLNFLSNEVIKKIASRHGFTIESLDHAKFTSNVLLIIRRENEGA